ncbi:peptidase [Bacteroidia bacterium]|nr:peptidase [Bacteroidia bacterium]
MKHYLSIIFVLMAFLAINVQAAEPESKISEPKFGEYTVGDDYFLANYTQLIQYWEKLEKESDRIKIVDFGTTPEGRTMKLAIITSAENHKNLKRYQDISVRLAKAEGLTDEEAKALAAEGKTVVWIDGGIHATEVINSQALFTEAYHFVSRNDAETKRILDNVILLLVQANPDGMELVSDWYMKESDPKKRNTNIPRLYQKYVGHDNNRDSYAVNQPETEAINRQMYIEWIPQIMYNQHQTGPAGTVLFFPPFRDPFNYNHDPLVPIGIDLVGSAVHNRFLAEGKGGAVMRGAAPYSTWFNGGDRTAVGFHNQIGLMHEIIGSPTPISIPLLPSKLLPNGEQPLPIGPQKEWHQRQSIDYVVSADYAILDIAAKMREDFLYRIYVMGKNSIERGSQDYWTLTPKSITAIETAYAKEKEAEKSDNSVDALFGDYFGRGIPDKFLDEFKTKENRDPRGYIIPSDQVDFLTATKFIAALQKAGVDIHRATSTFTVDGKSYPAGSYVVKAAQAFRPHLRDMFEPQDHPNDLQYPGGPPKPPYDLAGYTLAFQMGVQFDRILDKFDGPFEKIDGIVSHPEGKITGSGNTGYLLSHEVTDAFFGTTQLLANGEEIYWLTAPLKTNGKTYPEGTIYIPAKGSTRANLQKLADAVGLNFDAISSKPQGDALKIRPVKVALWDRYGGSMDSGWIRWLLEQAFPFPFDVIYPQALDAGNLKKKYDVIILPGGAIPAFGIDTSGFGRGGRGGNNNNVVPDEYKDRTGNVTAEKTIPQLRQFAEEGGVLLAIGSSTDLAYHLGLPVVNALTEIDANGAVKKLGREKFFVPGSVLRVKVDNTTPVAYGIPEDLDLMCNNSPAFRLLPDAQLKGVNTVAWFPNAEPLRSGWAWGQFYLNGSSAVVEANVGKGKVFLFGPEITFRGQPHASFKFLFNSIYYAGATPVKLK